MMSKGSRIMVLVAALALGLAYVLPVWRIDLEAPQYPEGLGMLIRINTIEGVKRHDLSNINNLNHYIGMKAIEPDAVPALRIMPAVLGGLLGLGLLTAALGRRKALYAFTGLFLAFALAGMADFWRWNYDYGHNLDHENAILKIPGQSYQPPLIGSRQILNFRAHSWPASGGWILIAAGGLFSLVSLSELRRGRRQGGTSGGGSAAAGGGVADVVPPGGAFPAASVPAVAALLVAGTLTAASCSGPQPRPIAYGSDSCEHCRMSVVGEGHGTQAVAKTGRVYVFDSVECMAAWFEGLDDRATVHSLWVTDFDNQPELVRAESAFYLASAGLPSPMGLGLTAFATAPARDAALERHGGEALDWPDVQALVAERWPGGSPQRGSGETMAPPAPHAH